MTTFVLIHGAGDSGWAWHLVEAELRARGHDVVAPDLPADDDALTLDDYADVVLESVGDRGDLVVVGHSFGGLTAPIVAARRAADVRSLVLLAGMIGLPGERPGDWWANVDYEEAVAEQASMDGGLTGHPDPFVSYYHDVPRALAEEALRRERAHPSDAASSTPWPLDAWPDVPTRFVLCADDRFFPASLFRRLVPERLGIVPEEIPGSHCVALSRPRELADVIDLADTGDNQDHLS